MMDDVSSALEDALADIYNCTMQLEGIQSYLQTRMPIGGLLAVLNCDYKVYVDEEQLTLADGKRPFIRFKRYEFFREGTFERCLESSSIAVTRNGYDVEIPEEAIDFCTLNPIGKEVEYDDDE